MTGVQIQKVSLSQGLAYASPLFCSAFLLAPTGTVLLGLYAKHFGVTLATIAMVVFIARMFDVITDPLIGYFADRYRSRTGTRKPFIVIGCIGLIISSYFLFMPPNPVSTGYFLTWFIAFYLALTLIEIPHTAWGSDLVTDYQEKNRIYTLRSSLTYMGLLAFTLIPFLPIFDTTEYTPETLKWSVLIIAIIMVPSLYTCITKAPNGTVVAQRKKQSIRLSWVSIFFNRPLLIILGSILLITAGFGTFVGLSFSVIDSYLNLGDKLPLLGALGTIVTLASLAVWYRLANYWGKKLTFGLGVLLIGTGLFGLQILEPGESAFLQYLVLSTTQYIGWGSVGVLGPSLTSDTIDYGKWKFGIDCSGLYFSFYFLLNKIGLGLGAALGLGVAGWYGFDPTAPMHSEQSLRGMFLVIAYIPALFISMAGLLVIKIPINAHRHKIIQRRLASRDQRYGNVGYKPLSKSNASESGMSSTISASTSVT